MAVQRNAIVSERAIKKRKKKQIMFGTVFGVVLSCLVAGIVWGAYSESFQIVQLNVRGTQGELENQIRESAQSMLQEKVMWVFPKSNTFLFPKHTLYQQIIDSYPKVLSVEVTKTGLKTLTIDVVERKAHSLWCSGVPPHLTPDVMGRCFFVDNTGYIYTQSPYFSDHVYFELYGEPYDYATALESASATSSDIDVDENMPETGEVSFIGLHYLPEESYLAAMQTVELLKSIDITTHTLVVHSKDFFELVMDEGGVIKFNLQAEPQQMVTDLKTALDAKFQERKDKTLKDIEYIDIRFTNKVVFKFVE